MTTTRDVGRASMIAAAAVFTLAGALAFDATAEINPELYQQLEYRYIGPPGNRISAVVGIPGDPSVYYVGGASGGIYKSTDGGTSWGPIFDDQPAASIGSLAVAPSDSNIVWAGTGETFIRSNVSIGNGIYKSTNAGKTWTHMGLDESGRIGRIVIDPSNPNIVLAAVMGHCYGPQQERGVYRTIDGGETWERVLFVDENTGCSDIAQDPNNPRILFAGMWPLVIRTWGRESGGLGGGLYRSEDRGATWKPVAGRGLPEPPIGKIGVAVAPSNSDRIYALIETEDGILWRSDDGGGSWQLVNSDHILTQRPHYYTRCAVAPEDHNEVYFLAPRALITLDGGLTVGSFPVVGGDHHDMWIDPLNPDRMMVGHDEGVSISTNRGQTWFVGYLPFAQMYHVHTDSRVPYYVYGNRQDGPSYRGPSNSLTGSLIPSSFWHHVGGSESGFAIPDPVDNNIVWSNYYDGRLDRFDLRTGHFQSVDVWPESTMGAAAKDVKYRFQWTFPIAISPHDHNRVYACSQHVHQTTDGGRSWAVISPDLSTNDKSKQLDSGGITVDNIQVDFFSTIFAIAESPLEEGLIWAGTNDGLVQVTRDGGAQWNNVTGNIPDLPPWGTVSNIEPSRFDAATCYITVDLHQVNDRDPYVYKTTDYGKTWSSISSDIPRSTFSYAHCVREDPARKGMLYLGTENSLYFSLNDGVEWLPLQTNLPHAPVHWLTIQDHFNDLVVGTYGRGFWIMDDVTPLQQLTPEVIESNVYFFVPRQAYRLRQFLSQGFSPRMLRNPNDQSFGQNPPPGASLNYYLKSIPQGDVRLIVADESGQTVRVLEGSKNKGINRIWWDLKYDAPTRAKLRTKPSKHLHTRLGPEGWRPLVTWAPHEGPLAAPGTYSMTLSVMGREYQQKLIIEKDPNTNGSDEDVRAQVRTLLELRADIDTVVVMINRIERVRRQIYDLLETVDGDSRAALVVDAANEMDVKLIAVEENLFAMHELTGGSSTDAFRSPMKLYAQLCQLQGSIAKSDYRPTSQQIEVHELLKGRRATYQIQFEELFNKEVVAFNDLLKENNLPGIFVAKRQ